MKSPEITTISQVVDIDWPARKSPARAFVPHQFNGVMPLVHFLVSKTSKKAGLVTISLANDAIIFDHSGTGALKIRAWIIRPVALGSPEDKEMQAKRERRRDIARRAARARWGKE